MIIKIVPLVTVVTMFYFVLIYLAMWYLNRKKLCTDIIGSLEPNRIYCIRVGNESLDWASEVSNVMSERLKEQNITLLFIWNDVEFVSIPEGYKLVKE